MTQPKEKKKKLGFKPSKLRFKSTVSHPAVKKGTVKCIHDEVSDRFLSMGQIELNRVLMLN